MTSLSDLKTEHPKWVHRCAILLACTTFPLIWVGGLVTTYDAGMAVPDWPNTYGYNMFLYPPTTWLSGPWDLLIEHGHRLLGSLAGLVAIGLVCVALKFERRRWVKALCLLALGLVIAQGTLGGIRVLAADRAIAKVHGCVGPAFFGLSVCIMAVTSRGWVRRLPLDQRNLKPATWALTLVILGLAYAQLVLGANLRHINLESDPFVFRAIVLFHVIGAFAVWFHGVLLRRRLRHVSLPQGLKRAVALLTLVLTLQLGLGLGTWVVKWGWPMTWGQTSWLTGWVVPAKSMFQANVVTVHVATGSLIIALSVWVCFRLARVTNFSRISLPFGRIKGVPA